MKIDILAIGVHPDDVELACSGTLLKHIALGKKVAILDLTQGELGTRGSAKIRMVEAAKAAKIVGVSIRENLKMKDGFFQNDASHQLEIIKKIRQYQPEIILCNAIHDRHPDHTRAAQLVSDAAYYSGLQKIETKLNGKTQDAWRPRAVYHYVQDRYIKPDFIVDVTAFVDTKMKAIMAFSSQFYSSQSKEPATPISSKSFMEYVKAQMAFMGRDIGVSYAEAFTTERKMGVRNLFDLL